MNTDKLTFITGDSRILNDLLVCGHQEGVSQGPKMPFSDEAADFLSRWSREILESIRKKRDSAAAAFALWCRKASIIQLSADYPDRGMRMGRGICLQFVPSNIPALFAYSLAAGILSGCSVIMRLSSRNDASGQMLITALRTVLDEDPVWKGRIILLQYGHDSEITDQLSASCDVRVIWGGDASIEDIRRSPLRQGAHEITFPDRQSMAVLDSRAVTDVPDISGLIRDFYNDTYFNDQNACSSPKLICWMGSREDAEKAGARFWTELDKYLAEKGYALQPHMTVKKLEQAMCMAGCGAADRIIPGMSDLNIVRVHQSRTDSGVWDWCMPGGFFIETVLNSPEELIPVLTDRCQTIACWGGSGLKEQIIQAASQAGDFNVTDAGHTLDFSLKWDRHDLIREMSCEKPEEITVYNAGARLYVRKQGTGPLLMLIHGVACDSSFFREAAAILARDHTVITYDRRGYSESIEDVSEGGLPDGSVSTQAEDAIRILDAVAGRGSKASVCGCSAGGVIALEIAAKYPERVSSLFIYEAAYTTDQEQLDMMSGWKKQLCEAASRKSLAKAMLLFIQAIGTADPLAVELTPAQLQHNMLNLERFLTCEMDSILGYADNNRDIRLTVPVYLAAGTLDKDNLFGRMMEKTASAWNAPFTELGGCHNIAQDRPAVFAGWIRIKQEGI